MLKKLFSLFGARASARHEERAQAWVQDECRRMQSPAYMEGLLREALRNVRDEVAGQAAGCSVLVRCQKSSLHDNKR